MQADARDIDHGHRAQTGQIQVDDAPQAQQAGPVDAFEAVAGIFHGTDGLPYIARQQQLLVGDGHGLFDFGQRTILLVDRQVAIEGFEGLLLSLTVANPAFQTGHACFQVMRGCLELLGQCARLAAGCIQAGQLGLHVRARLLDFALGLESAQYGLLVQLACV